MELISSLFQYLHQTRGYSDIMSALPEYILKK